MSKTRVSRRLGALALTTTLALVAVACGGDDDTTTPAPTDGAPAATGGNDSPGDTGAPAPGGEIDRDATLRYGMNLAQVTGFDPVADGAGNVSRSNYLDLIYDTMIREDLEGNPVPGLAIEWSTPDDSTIDLKLREGVTFHDGTPFNAEAVEFSWERCINHPTVLKLEEHLAMESVDVLGEYEVRLNLNAPIAGAFLEWVLRSSTFCMAIASPTAVQELGDEGFEAAPVGAGPYRFVSYEPDQKIVLERVDDHWSPGNFKRIEFHHVVAGPSAITALASGQLDVAVMASSVMDQATAAGVDVIVQPGELVTYLYLCTTDELLSNVDARLAIAKAIDRAQIAQVAYNGHADPVETVVVPHRARHATELDGTERMAYDPEAAAQLAQSSGLAGQKVEIMINSLSPAFVGIAEVLQQQLKAIDVDLEIIPTQNAFADKNTKLPDTEVWSLSDYWMGTVLELGQINNYCKNDTPAVTEAYEKVWLTTSTPEENQQAWHDYQAAVQETLPLVPLVADVAVIGHNLGDKLGGVRLRAAAQDLRLAYVTS